MNHPVMITAANLLNEGLDRRKNARDLGQSEQAIQEQCRKRNKCWLILLLIKHPWLREHRKAAIAARRESKEGKKDVVQPAMKAADVVGKETDEVPLEVTQR